MNTSFIPRKKSDQFLKQIRGQLKYKFDRPSLYTQEFDTCSYLSSKF